MILSTRTKFLLARPAQRAILAGLQLRGLGPRLVTRRRGITWDLDLNEGIDFAIYVFGAFEPDTVAAYDRIVAPGATVLDIGANIGAHTLHLARLVRPGGRVIAVEPTRYAVGRLRENLALNPDFASRVTVVQAMLMGNTDVLLADSIPSSWPLQTPEGAHEKHLGVGMSTEGAGVTTADALVSQYGLTSVDLIKLDVDGYEVEVLRGARNILEKFGPPILFEHSPYNIAEKGYDPHEMLGILKDAGYRFGFSAKGSVELDHWQVPTVPDASGINLIARKTRDLR